MTDHNECGFCGKSKQEVKKLIVGEDAAICNNCVDLCNELLIDKDDIAEQTTDSTRNLYPEDIKQYLDQYVIGQEQAKKVLSVAVCNHYKRINNKSDDIEVQKSNILLMGPTGCGKTLLAKTIAKYLAVPFVIADATTLTEAGYVGADVDSMISLLLQRADNDVELAQRGIIFIDEVDKISRKSESTSITRDVSGEGVQQALLKLVEGTECQVPISGASKRKHPKQDTITVDTSSILFIASGAFVGLDELIAKRVNNNSIGFNSAAFTSKISNNLGNLKPQDLVKFGLIPEFIGRFPNKVSVQEMTASELLQILTDVKNSYIQQYKYLLSLDGINLEFTETALSKIVENCIEMETGARGLHSELERVLMHVMYSAKSLASHVDIVIDHEIVDNPEYVYTKYPMEKE